MEITHISLLMELQNCIYEGSGYMAACSAYYDDFTKELSLMVRYNLDAYTEKRNQNTLERYKDA
jgi:hypothetical protein